MATGPTTRRVIQGRSCVEQKKETTAGVIGRRKLIAALGLGAGAAALLPKSWKKPIADMVEVPLYAQGSPPPGPPPGPPPL